MKKAVNARTYVNPNTFMVEILGMTNACNLRCEYCDWEKFKYSPLTQEEKQKVHENLQNTRTFIKKHYPAAQMIEYSGGEPFVYPEIVGEILDTFPDYWVRVITNATLVKPEDIKHMAKHGKAFLSISLDGATLEANKSRRITEKQLNTILTNIDLALNSGVPVMLLCTLNEDNIEAFKDYISFLDNKWSKFVESGMLVLPAHILSSYDVKHRGASKTQQDNFKKALKAINSPIITNIREHYDSLYASKKYCSVYQWTASIHFLNRAIATTGDFTTFRCGMRGVGKIGTFNVASEIEKDTFSIVMNDSLKTSFESFKCGCTVDWNAIDLILAGVIPMERASKWFVVFQDQKIKEWTQTHKDAFTMAYLKCWGKEPCIEKRLNK
ncbi:MAG: radical SAM protein [Clostridia bacterium]|nr:radical SAM protein [Clostridia bacterium]